MADKLIDLKKKFSDDIEKCALHDFNSELCNGTLDDSKLFVYLVMDLTFFLGSVRMLARTASLCDSDKALIRLGKQIGMLCKDENEYFDRTLAELRSGLQAKIKAKGEPPVPADVNEYIKFVDEATQSTSYAECITAIYVFEMVYLKWAELADPTIIPRLAYKHREWINLHSGPEFSEWVGFLESEVIRVLGLGTYETVEQVFGRTVRLEKLFFDSCYDLKW